jgi:amino acid adenylation domain-containing protein
LNSHPSSSSVTPPADSLSERFRWIARLHPDRLAVSDGDRSLSYAELDRHSEIIAYQLVAQKPVPSPAVAVLARNGISFATALLGVLKAGRAYVPLDPNQPQSRIATIIADSGANVLIADPECTVLARNIASPDIRILGSEPDTATPPATLPRTTAEQPALIIYTSGSTGTPKGVLHDHRTILHNTQVQLDLLDLVSADRWLSSYSNAVAASVRNLFAALLVGSSLHFYNIRDRGVHGLANFLESKQITIAHLAVSAFQSFCAATPETPAYPSVRLVILGGEAVPARTLAAWKNRFAAPSQLCTGFGSSEALSIRVGLLDHSSNPDPNFRHLTTGLPVLEKEVVIVDDAGDPVPDGTTGEITIHSPFLACGYWRDEQKTSALFSASDQDARLRVFRSGDYGKILPSGRLVVEGRRDFQVKIRGNRVDLGEVEFALTQLPSVLRAAAICTNQGQLDATLVGFVVLAADKSGAGQDFTRSLRRALTELLPPPMVPEDIVVVDRFPETPNGKIDRRALEAIPLPPRPPTAGQLPQNPLEEQLVAAWTEILEVESLGVDRDLFESGADSMKVIRFCALASSRLPHKIEVADVYTHPTISALASLLANGTNRPTASPISFGDPGTGPPLFLAPGIDRTPFYLKDIAISLSKNQPCFGLQACGQDGSGIEKETLLSLAKICAKQVRSTDPSSPVFLAGYSFGGILAFATAQLLQNENIDVAGVILLDSCPMKAPRFDSQRKIGLVERIRWTTKILTRFPNRQKINYLKFVVSCLRPRLRLPNTDPGPGSHLNRRDFWISSKIMDSFQPAIASFPVLLLLSGSYQASIRRNLIANWSEIAPDLNTRPLSAFHHLEVLDSTRHSEIVSYINAFVASRLPISNAVDNAHPRDPENVQQDD